MDQQAKTTFQETQKYITNVRDLMAFKKAVS